MMKFILSEYEIKKLNVWVKEQTRIALEEQKKNPPDIPLDILKTCWDLGQPYSGAIGGSLSYTFTPTSLGTITTVKSSFTGEKIDLTDYSFW